MKNEEKKDEPKRPQKGISAKDMTEKEMEELLVELSNTQYWQAVMRFIDVRCELVENSLYALDAFKYPTDVARNQGLRMGLLDMYTYVIDSIDKRKKEEDKINNK